MEDLPYRVEYAKSGRASCKGCKTAIEKAKLRVAVMVQSPVYDGKVPNWYHTECFFKKQRPKSIDDFEHFESIRWEDQQNIKAKITSTASVIVPTKKGKKRDAATTVALKDYTLEYSKSSRAMCRGCEIKIMKEEVRIAKKDFETEHGRKYGGQDMWHHLTCFAKLRSELGFYECGDKLPGFKDLKKEDQKSVLKEIPAIKQEDVPEVKKVKKEEDVPDGFDKMLESQNKEMFAKRDQLQKNLSKEEMTTMLEDNEQIIPPGVDRILDHLSDMLVFGRLLPCPECKEGQFRATQGGYTCTGNLTEWTKCENRTKDPQRQACVIPADLADEYGFLKKYKYRKRCRVFRDVPVVVKADVKAEENGKPKVERDLPAFYDHTFVILGKPDRGKDKLKADIVKLGGKLVTRITSDVLAVFAHPSDVEKMGARISEAKTAGVHVVPEAFVDEAPAHVGKIPELLERVAICDWGVNPSTRLLSRPTTSTQLKSSSAPSTSKSRSIYTRSIPSTQRVKLKGGAPVDPDSGLEDVAHVYVTPDGTKYTCVLGETNIQRQKNSFYKLQVLEADRSGRTWLFRSWGRIGTTIGGNKVEELSMEEAIEQYHTLYHQKSGNRWENRNNFVKVTGRMYPIDMDYGEDDSKLDIKDDDASKHPKEIQDLIKLIFNVNNMKNLMLEFELDMEKMPLGKLSKQQIKKAYCVLTELQELITNGDIDSKFIDASNRFYTYIPHTFGVEAPTTIKDPDVIKQKIDMLDNLLELEIAYNLMQSSGTGTIDSHYEKLNTDLDIVDQKSEEFKLLEQYVKNTHAATHTQYKLKVLNAFTVKRKGEDKRFKPFKKMHNRQLLWHGSRTTNFAGILSQGLRIAPPEAPVTGYMFGKGIYFADMVSKSANYCCTSPGNCTGLLLLCDVALGDMYELKSAKYIDKLPKGKHSCKGVGRTQPNPSESVPLLDTGVTVPLGKPKPGDLAQTDLLYNEYIVYDIAQVNVKYLIEMDFQYAY